MPDNHIAVLRQMIEKGLIDIPLPKNPTKLYAPMQYILALGGKRIRPILTLLGAELFGAEAKLALPQALAVEVFHNFTLVHDDIMDRADVRRNTPTVHKKWDDNVAILSGDGMMVLAYQLLADAKPEHLPTLFKIFSATALEVCEGQQYDMDLAHAEEVFMPQYIEMIRLKTAVLLTAAMQIGAKVAGANKADLDQIKVFTENIGLAFQIRDDYLDAFGSQADFGKKIGGDIIEGKRTWLTVRALEKANSAQHKALLDAYADSDLDKRVKTVLELYKALNVEQDAQVAIEALSSTAMNGLEQVDGNESVKGELETLVHYLMGRTK
ncbi:MAG: polyprenyl synthetase family protein [Salibacteraceae bacterium]|jgi:geranylgeranyl diphosphate synthase, type II|nr:polyprenyl synthetase family protein [Salibacteraceae bacterium]MDP4687097.1 polyprenyl synthetase family protein [Salibacteraceae bacterium]MDP4764528.1 polyprenyl synthetase family protein [Salibacteraceae bacterium]MDP4843073.1 polyprenyl synthetase family protein [Salibacteraceae bacterium]MDP4933298.1 polyprenyl synthetase family protein [Salibacteraceae bacterium]